MVQKENLALLGVGVFDGLHDEIFEDRAVLIRGQRIERIIPMADYRGDSEYRELQLDGHYVMPGMIDCHVHLSGGRAGVEEQELGLVSEPMLMRAIRSVYEAQAVLKRGFTAARDVSWNGLYLKRMFFEGVVPGPKVIACGPGLSRTGGHGDMFQFTEEYTKSHAVWGMMADGPEEVRKGVRRLLREGADQIKVWASGGDNWPHDRMGDVHYTFEELRMIVEEAHRQQGTGVMCHAENRESIKLALDAGVDTIEHGEALDEELVEQMKRQGTILIPTLELIVNWYRDFIPLSDAGQQAKTRPDTFLYRDLYLCRDHDFGQEYSQSAVASFQLALESGVKIGLGSDTVFEPLTRYGEYSAREYKALNQHGMTKFQALHAGTKVSSEAVGMADFIGTLEPGKLADMLVLRANPLEDLNAFYDESNIHLVLTDGRIAVQDGAFMWGDPNSTAV